MTASSLDPPAAEPSHRSLEQAAGWFAVLDSGEATAADRRHWEAWLAESAEHREAWRYVERISRRFDPIKTSPERGSALAAYRQASGDRARQRRTLLGLAALAGSGLAGWAAWRQTDLPRLALAWVADYRSGTGEVRDVVLSDGTRVWLNAQSAFNRDYRTDRRCLHLVRGEILVDTAADPQGRPFYVETPQGRMQALGTRFAVRQDAHETFLAVYEGAVQVRTAGTDAGAVIPTGRQTRFTRAALAATEAADPSREAWTRGLLVARDTPLREVVGELRRYYPGHLGLAPEVADLPVFGGYPLNRPDQALAMLEAVLPIRVRRTLPWWVSIEARGAAPGG
ncbi:iron dicitrate transport regulator FecR [Bordetella genomosp. 10]|uniref:Iron dicitrate transport regulator FecR n=1 Tax=Bordetella genomosp. 10 TaxID=1416804 RepID=A0A261S3S1_9BORD|nr:FecR family protein [Bordetella genomosp. 10]OZI31998.1 iron dicitrate transport regulator FecR [Bordetella genomosp. 10]